MPIKPALRNLRQEDHEFKASLYCFKKGKGGEKKEGIGKGKRRRIRNLLTQLDLLATLQKRRFALLILGSPETKQAHIMEA
jgi:hypothetical protein